MAKSFASVDWLSQSSHDDNQKTILTSEDHQTSCHPWDPLMRSFPKIAHVFPYPETQRLTYPGNNDVSSYLKDNEQSTTSNIYNDPSWTLDNQRVSPLHEKNLEESCSPNYNGQHNASENFVSISKESNISEDLPSATEESCDNQGESTSFNEDISHSACSSNTESGYDSETCRSSSKSPVSSVAEESSDTSDEEGKVGRRLRTAFTTEQITALKNNFQKHRYLGASERQKLAAKLNLSEVQIKTWFQNRRMKHKREIQEGKQMQFFTTPFYGLYGYPPQPMPSYHYIHPREQLHVQNPLVDPMSYSYPSPPTAFDSLNTLSPPSLPAMYLPQQSFIPPVWHEEPHFVRY
ncbi:uncharacterized protein LOC143767561 [Ranitomeya variabilis]|uniref:uncharacterized protein LOC143767561 n=1 Tax=Ranitomeya variabilis TaxID=490064 RepID=UPI00405696AF